MKLALSDKQIQFQTSCLEFTQEQVTPHAGGFDQEQKLPESIIAALGKQQYQD